MNTPHPLPEPGWWLVMPDGGLYEARHCRTAHGPCSVSVADDAGCYYYSVSDDEVLWTPWSDVDSVYEDGDEAEVRADELADEWQARRIGAVILGVDSARRPDITAYRLTIRHDASTPPPAHVMRAAASVISAALGAAGVVAAVTIEPDKED